MKCGEFLHRVEPQCCDAQGRLPLPAFITWLIEAASNHAENHGFGYTRLRDDNRAWVLARIAIELVQSPKAYENVLLTTWVEDINRLFSTQNFALLSPSKEDNSIVYAYAKTQWSVIDLTTRKVCDLSSMGAISDLKADYICPIIPPGKINSVNGDLVGEYKVKYADLDVNRHMNTVKYVEHALNLFTLNFFDTHELRRMEVQFIAEARFDDTLTFCRKDEGEGVYAIEMHNSEGLPINRLKIWFAQKGCAKNNI